MTTIYRQKGRKRWYYKIQQADGTWLRRVGFTDRRATEEVARREQRALDRGEMGLTDPYAETRHAPLVGLVDAYGKWLEARARSKRYVTGVVDRLKLVVVVSGARVVSDLDYAAIDGFLARLVRGDLPPERPKSIWTKPVPRRPASMVTRDRYVEAIRSFGAWLFQTDRWGSHPWQRLRKESRQSDRRMEHRALSESELQLLVDAAEVRCVEQWASSGTLHGGQRRDATIEAVRRRGWMRGTLYLFAAFTGLRLNECSLLRRGDLVLDGDEAHVVVRAQNAKNRTEQRVPLLPMVVDRLRQHLQMQNDQAQQHDGVTLDGSAPVFEVRRGLLEAMRKDAEWAGLGLDDAAGRRLTFHGLRASTATLLARNGVSLPIAMRVLRHSDANLTASVYAKLDMGDMHRELREKVRPQVRPQLPNGGAAACHSVPSSPNSGEAQQPAEMAAGQAIPTSGVSPCRSVPEGPETAKWWALQESNPPLQQPAKASGDWHGVAPEDAVTTGVTMDCSRSIPTCSAETRARLVAELRWAAGVLREAGWPPPLPADLLADLRDLLLASGPAAGQAVQS
jgi:integrase